MRTFHINEVTLVAFFLVCFYLACFQVSSVRHVESFDHAIQCCHLQRSYLRTVGLPQKKVSQKVLSSLSFGGFHVSISFPALGYVHRCELACLYMVYVLVGVPIVVRRCNDPSNS